MKKAQFGFSIVEILLVLVLISILGFGGYYVWQTQSDTQQLQPNSPEKSSISEPQNGHIVTNTIKLVTGQYMPAVIDIKKGDTVTWEISDSGEIPDYAIASDIDSAEVFSSNDLKSGDQFSHTFNKVGTFGWHDKYNGNLKGSVTVKE